MTNIRDRYHKMNERNSELQERYFKTRGETLTEKSLDRIRKLKFWMAGILIINYILALFDLYAYIYDYIPNLYLEIYSDIYIALPRIRAEMLYRGDSYLYSKYTVFSNINLLVLLFSALFTYGFFERRVTHPDTDMHGFKRYLMLSITILLFFMSIYLLNVAGYDNARVRVFPVLPALGGGSFFFIRDTALFLFYYLMVIEISIIACLIYRPLRLEK